MTRVVLAILLSSCLLPAQLRGRRTRQSTDTAGAYNLPAVTFRGELKELTAKAVILEGADGQVATIYRNRKTRFLQGQDAVDPKQIAVGTELTLDVAKNPDGSLLAVNVMVGKQGHAEK